MAKHPPSDKSLLTSPAEFIGAMVIIIFALGVGNAVGKVKTADQLIDYLNVTDFISGSLNSYPIVLIIIFAITTAEIAINLLNRHDSKLIIIATAFFWMISLLTFTSIYVSSYLSRSISFGNEPASIAIIFSLVVFVLAMIFVMQFANNSRLRDIGILIALFIIATASAQLAKAATEKNILNDHEISTTRSIVCAEECRPGVIVTSTDSMLAVRYKGDVSYTYIPRDKMKYYRTHVRIKQLGFTALPEYQSKRRAE